MTAGAAAVLRWTGLVLALGFALTGRWVEAAVSMLVALAQVLAWRTRLPRGWEVAVSLTALVAALSSFARLYERLPWWDVPVHLVTTGTVAVLAAWVVRRERAGALTVLGWGCLLAVLWEGLELWGHVVVDPTVHVPPGDTALDLACGIFGAALAGLCRRTWQRGAEERPGAGRGDHRGRDAG